MESRHTSILAQRQAEASRKATVALPVAYRPHQLRFPVELRKKPARHQLWLLTPRKIKTARIGKSGSLIEAEADALHVPSKEAVDTGSTGAMPEALDQLDELLASLGSSTETK